MQGHTPPVTRLDGSVHADVPAPPRPAFLSMVYPRLVLDRPLCVTDHTDDLGMAIIHLGESRDLDLHLYSEEQAQLLIAAASRAAGMFASAKMTEATR